MILHIGNGKTVRGEEIVGIFDLDNATLAKESRTFLSAATRAGEVSYADSDIPRSFLVTAKKKQKITADKEPINNTVGEDIILPLTNQFTVGEGSPLPPNPCEMAVGASPRPTGNENRPRHPARKKPPKRTPPVQGVLLSHISSVALHARTERPFEVEET